MKYQFILQKRQPENQPPYTEPVIVLTLTPQEYDMVVAEIQLFNELHVKFNESTKEIAVSLSHLDEKTSAPSLTDPTSLRIYLCRLKEAFGKQEGVHKICEDFTFFVNKHKSDLILNFDEYQKSLETDFPDLQLDHIRGNLRSTDSSSFLSRWTSDIAGIVGSFFASNGKADLALDPLQPVTKLSDEDFDSCKKMLDDLFHKNKSIDYNSSSYGDMDHEFKSQNIEPIKKLLHELKEKKIVVANETVKNNSYSFRITRCNIKQLSDYHFNFMTSENYRHDSYGFDSFGGSLIITDRDTFPFP